jgi:N-acyl-D-aspartate/D-glutamate deacylase
MTLRRIEACLLFFACSAFAQRIDVLGAGVRKYVSVSTAKVILEHVEVIDGTGAAPQPDRNVYIDDGKIEAISPGADEPPKKGTTILDLRGRSVIPGIVGMHTISSTSPSQATGRGSSSR